MTTKIFCIVTIAVLSTACHKNKTAAQPVVTAPPTAERPAKPRRAATTANVPAAVRPAAPVTPAEAPHLRQMQSPAEMRQYNALIDQSIGNAQSSLRSIGSRKVTAEQQNGVKEIQDFIRQANEIRKTDLLEAKGLADKAEVLARDLVRGLK